MNKLKLKIADKITTMRENIQRAEEMDADFELWSISVELEALENMVQAL